MTTNIGRPTLDKKGRDINVRINDEMRDWLEKRSASCGMSISEYMRYLIKNDMRRTF